MPPKKLGLTGLFIAFVIALPLFVWTAINVNFNVSERAQGEPNFCGGSCGSNYNCQANFYCHKGFCKNPICSDDTDCICDAPTTIPTTTAISTKKPTEKPSPTITSIPKGGNETFVNLATEIAKPKITATPSTIPTISPPLENQFFVKNALLSFAVFVLIAIIAIYFTVKHKKTSDILHILPPTNI